MAKRKVNQPSDWKRYKIEVVRHEIADAKPFRIESPRAAADLFRDDAKRLANESLWVLTVDSRNGLLGIDQVYTGTATGTSVRIGELFRYAVAVGGVGIVLVHNHPSGDAQPSDEDVRLTKEAIAASKLLDIEVLDHLVIGEASYESIRTANGSLWSAPMIPAFA